MNCHISTDYLEAAHSGSVSTGRGRMWEAKEALPIKWFLMDTS